MLADLFKKKPVVTKSCNICGASEWKDMNTRSGVRCASCNSLERTRALKVVLDSLGLPKRDSRILHFAPENGLAEIFRNVSPDGYDPVDLFPEKFRVEGIRKFDLVTDSSNLPSNHYDLIIHSHIIEHIPCNLAYVFFHLSRTLKPDGVHIFCAPFMGNHYDEYFGPLEPEVAVKRFGQDDHCRRLSVKDINLHLGMIMKLKPRYDLADYADDATLDACNIPTPDRSGINSSTIFVASKTDYLLA